MKKSIAKFKGAAKTKRPRRLWKQSDYERMLKKFQCPLCSRNIKTLRQGYAFISFGALPVDPENDVTDAIEGFCDMGFHGYYPEMPDMEDYFIHDVAENARMGQMEIEFCSLSCMRQWFNAIVDHLEDQIARQLVHQTQKKGRNNKGLKRRRTQKK